MSLILLCTFSKAHHPSGFFGARSLNSQGAPVDLSCMCVVSLHLGNCKSERCFHVWCVGNCTCETFCNYECAINATKPANLTLFRMTPKGYVLRVNIVFSFIWSFARGHFGVYLSIGMQASDHMAVELSVHMYSTFVVRETPPCRQRIRAWLYWTI